MGNQGPREGIQRLKLSWPEEKPDLDPCTRWEYDRSEFVIDSRSGCTPTSSPVSLRGLPVASPAAAMDASGQL